MFNFLVTEDANTNMKKDTRCGVFFHQIKIKAAWSDFITITVPNDSPYKPIIFKNYRLLPYSLAESVSFQSKKYP